LWRRRARAGLRHRDRRPPVRVAAAADRHHGAMSAVIPPRPDVPGGAFPAPPWSEAGPPPASWRWWEAILLYLAGQLVAGILLIPLLSLGDLDAANGGATGLGIAAAMLTEILVTGMLVLWLRSRHPRWFATVRFPSKSRVPKEV